MPTKDMAIHIRNLSFNPNLAVQVGLNEAIFIQQLYYWLSKSKHIIEERTWVYNSYEEWQKQFPFWSLRTIQRTIASLEKRHLLLSGNFNLSKTNRTKWYSLDFNKLSDLLGEKADALVCQVDKLHGDKLSGSMNKEHKTNLQRMQDKVREKLSYLKPSQKNKNEGSLGDWSPSQSDRDQVLKTLTWDGGRLESEILRFKTYYSKQLSNGRVYRGWDRLWQMWCVRAESFAQERQSRSGRQEKMGSELLIDRMQKLTVEKQAQEKVTQALEEREKKKSPYTDLWHKVSEKLVSTLGASVYISWLKDLVIEKAEEGIICLRAKGRFAADYISANLLESIKKAFESLYLQRQVSVALVY